MNAETHSRRFIAAAHGNTYCPTGVQVFSPRSVLRAHLGTLLGFLAGCGGMLAVIIALGAAHG